MSDERPRGDTPPEDPLCGECHKPLDTTKHTECIQCCDTEVGFHEKCMVDKLTAKCMICHKESDLLEKAAYFCDTCKQQIMMHQGALATECCGIKKQVHFDTECLKCATCGSSHSGKLSVHERAGY